VSVPCHLLIEAVITDDHIVVGYDRLIALTTTLNLVKAVSTQLTDMLIVGVVARLFVRAQSILILPSARDAF
jgi:hypothetical protein